MCHYVEGHLKLHFCEYASDIQVEDGLAEKLEVEGVISNNEVLGIELFGSNSLCG